MNFSMIICLNLSHGRTYQQELHNLAMNIVGKISKNRVMSFLGVNSEFKKDPQFVALKNKKFHFVIVRAIEYPYDPTRNRYDLSGDHQAACAKSLNARTFYAGVGLANSKDYELPVSSA